MPHRELQLEKGDRDLLLRRSAEIYTVVMTIQQICSGEVMVTA